MARIHGLWMSCLLAGLLGIPFSDVILAEDGPIVCIDLQTSMIPDPETITATYSGSGPTVYAFLVVTEIPGDRVSGISVGFDLSTDGSVTNSGFTLLEGWDPSSESAYGFDPAPEGPGEMVPTAIGYWTLELSVGSSSTATLSLVAPGGANGEAIVIVDGDRRGFAPAEARHAAINTSAPTTTISDPLHGYLSVRQHHVLMQSLGQSMVMPRGLIGAPLHAFTSMDSTLRASFLPYEPVRIDKVFPLSDAATDSVAIMSDGFHLPMPKLWSIFKISVADTSYVDLLIDDLLDTGRARFAMPNVRAELAIEPNDPGYPDQWHLENDDGEGECPPGSPGHPGECEEDSDLDAAAAWNVTVGDPGIIISIIDSGIRRDHEDLQDRNIIGDLGHGLECYDNEDFEGHGTYAAGLIGATTNNDLGLAGVDWNCTLMAQCMDFSQEAVGQAILESVDAGALVLNMSFAWTETAHPKPECVRQALLNAFYRGVHPVAASGNFPVGLPRWPASYPNVISVGHVDCCDYGSAPTADWGDVVAPGKEVWTTSYGTSGYEKVSGSSFACPIAAGISSLLLSLDRGLNPALRDLDIHRILELTATDMGDPGYDPLFAWVG